MELAVLPRPISYREGGWLPPPQEPLPTVGLWLLIFTLPASGVHAQDKFLAMPLKKLSKK